MLHAGASGVINSSPEDIWALVSNVTTVDQWNPSVARVELLSERPVGFGAARRCHFRDGSNVREEIVAVDERRRVRFKLTEFSLPMKRLEAEFILTPAGSSATTVTFQLWYEMKMALLGKLIGATIVRRRLIQMATRVVAGVDRRMTEVKAHGHALP